MFQLHQIQMMFWNFMVFRDASTVAYCAAIYIRVISNSPVITSLLVAKCRLVQMKDHSIPRLELLACLLLLPI